MHKGRENYTFQPNMLQTQCFKFVTILKCSLSL